MPDTRLLKTRATLPEGYQFGDGRFSDPMLAFFARRIQPSIERSVNTGRSFTFMTKEWMTATERRRYRHWNTIEPE